MAKTPYLHRRGNNFYFRVTVPFRLRPLFGCREIVKTLKTQNHNEAVPLALFLGSKTKSLFNRVEAMSDKKDHSDELKQAFDLLIAEHDALPLTKQTSTHDRLTLDQRATQWRRELKHTQDKEDLHDQIIEQKLQHIAEIKLNDTHSADKEKAVREALATLSEHFGSQPITTTTLEKTSPLLSKAIEDYIRRYESKDKKAMLRKVKSVLPIFLELIGDKPVHSIKQQHINDFFELVQGLPPRWSDIKNKNPEVKYITIIKANTGDVMAEKTLFDTYRAAVRLFLKSAYTHLKDQNFPNLTTDDDVVIYTGDSPSGKNKQRAFKPAELKVLFEGSLMQEFATDKRKAHFYWLPHLGLFTGARINELCQINPQTDIEEIDGVWCLKFSTKTASDPRITKRLKNKSSIRNVPIHSKLIELGFLDYFEYVKKRKATLLFPAWTPSQDRAATNAIKWFSRHLESTEPKLRDDTREAKITGFHAFRHTFITKAVNLKLKAETPQITGHGDGIESSSYDGYVDIEGIDMRTVKPVIEKFNFDLSFIKPVKP